MATVTVIEFSKSGSQSSALIAGREMDAAGFLK